MKLMNSRLISVRSWKNYAIVVASLKTFIESCKLKLGKVTTTNQKMMKNWKTTNKDQLQPWRLEIAATQTKSACAD